MLIQEFHSTLDLRGDRNKLFNALRRLRLVEGLKSIAVEEGGWLVWTDTVSDPDDDGGSFRFASALA